MKRSINIKSLTVALSLVLSGAGMSGCAGFLERDNPIATTDERWWLTEGHLTNAVNDVYNNSVNSGVITYNRPQYSGSANYSWAYVNLTGLTDDGIFASNYQDWSPFTNGGATSSHRYVHEYYLKYNYIRRASRVLENYHRVKGINNKKAEDGILLKERLAAEARAMRAYLHMEMFFFFGPVPIIDHSLDVSEQNIARAGQEELVKFIVDEFELAAQNLPRAYTAESDTWRFTKGACYAFAAKTLLHVGKYSEAAGMAKLVVDMTNDDMTPVYELYIDGTNPAMSYGKMFEYAGQTCKERVFYSKGGNVQVFRRLAPASVSSGQSGISPTAALVNSYETKDGYALDELPEAEKANYIKDPHYNDNRDPRLRMSIWFPNETFLDATPNPWLLSGTDGLGRSMSTMTGYWVKKWLTERDNGKVAAEAGTLDFFILRYAEVLLIYVEALVESGQWNHADVTKYLNQIRSRAGMPDVDVTRYDSQAKMRELVRRERRVELAFEGQRLFDIRRWNIAEQVMNTKVYGAVRPGEDTPVEIETRRFSSRDYYWPIPIEEMNNNSAMVQNPGW